MGQTGHQTFKRETGLLRIKTNVLIIKFLIILNLHMSYFTPLSSISFTLHVLKQKEYIRIKMEKLGRSYIPSRSLSQRAAHGELQQEVWLRQMGVG